MSSSDILDVIADYFNPSNVEESCSDGDTELEESSSDDEMELEELNEAATRHEPTAVLSGCDTASSHEPIITSSRSDTAVES